MKGLSRITALIISIVLTAAIASAQMLYCLHSTLMSPQHLSHLLENDQRLAELTGIIYKSFETQGNSDTQGIFLKQYMAKILANTDQAWLKSQIYISAKGVHQYVLSETTVLPTLDIIPLKKAINAMLISDIMKSNQAKQRVEKIKTILSALNNKYFARIVTLGLNNQLVSMLFELSPIRSTGFDKAAINEIIRIYLSLNNQSISLEQASCSIAEQMTADMLKLNEIKDYFDLSLFMDKAFGELDPLKALKAFVSSVDRTVTWAVNIVLWGTLLLLAINKRFQLISIAKTTVLCTLIASLIQLCLSALLINKAFIEGIISHMYNIQSALSVFITEYIGLLIRDFGHYLALQAFITGLLCTALLLLVSRFKASDKKEKGRRLFPVIRLSLGISAALLVIMLMSSIALSNEYKNFKSSIAQLSQIDASQSVKNGLIEAGDMEFLNSIESTR